MLNIELIRGQPDWVRRGLAKRGAPDSIGQLTKLDEDRRSLILKGDGLRAKRNETSKKVGFLIKGGSESTAEEMRLEVREIGEHLQQIERQLSELETGFRELSLSIPNLPLDDVPEGTDETANVLIRQEGEIIAPDFPLKPHWELAENLGITDIERGAKLSGSRFYVLREPGIRLQRALINWMLDFHRTHHGYREVGLPYLVRRQTMEDSGNLPKFSENLYHDNEDDLWLIPTGEVPLTGLHRDEILTNSILPLKYMTHTPSFRREKAAAGKDVRGIKRVHQFEKVEMYKFVEPKESDRALDAMISDAEDICEGLGLPYRIVQLCTADIGFAAIETYDVEVWAAGSQEWLEVSSCSNCGDFQARRANIRYRPQMGARPLFVHTLNGSGLGLPRVLIAILENYQQADGTITIPDILRPYTGFEHIK